MMIIAKVHNQKWVLERVKRDHAAILDGSKLPRACQKMQSMIHSIRQAANDDELRGLEGVAAQIYFSAFDSMILRQKNDFVFLSRERRPPLDPVNAALSYLYVVLNYDCAGALEAVGLDPYVGLFHTDRPGRTSLALDLSEEFRAVMVDRLVLTAINTKQLNIKHFEKKENGAVLLSEEGKSTIINLWQNRKKEIVTHPFLGEKIEMGLLPYAQALLLARTIRGDLEKYPPFLYRV